MITHFTEKKCESPDSHVLWKSGMVRIQIRVPWRSTERFDHQIINAWLMLNNYTLDSWHIICIVINSVLETHRHTIVYTITFIVCYTFPNNI